jgi:hypothetical protein
MTMTESTLRQLTLRAEMADGSHKIANVRNPDFIRWELTAAKERWPIVEVSPTGDARVAAPMLLNTFLAWAALSRQGDYAGKWDDFKNTDCMGVESVDETDVDPTQPEPGSG